MSRQPDCRITQQGACIFLMAEKARKIPIHHDGIDSIDSSFEAANAIPGVQDDQEDERGERLPIDLDAPVTPPVEAATPETSAAGTETSVSIKELEDLRAQVTQANENYLRTLADFQNFKRRGDESQKRLRQEANERLIKELLPILDDFDLALEAARKSESYEQLIGGVGAILRKFQGTLSKEGVEPIPAVGEPFNTEVHEAVMLDEDSEEPDETVTAELRKGYTLHDRVIRPSLVKVAKAG